MTDVEILESARVAFGHLELDDAGLLCMRIRQYERFRDERNAALDLIAGQARMIARQELVAAGHISD